jgi:hypothetical protein
MFQGTFSGLSFSTAQSIVLSVGQFSGTIPISGFTRQEGTNVYTYQDSTGTSPFWVSSLTLDLDAQTFTARASGIVLGGLPNPFPVELGTDQGTGCATARVGQSNPGTFELTGTGGCVIQDPPLVDPPVVLAGTPTTVAISVTIAAGAILDPTSVVLYRADGDAQPAGDPLCRLTVDPTGTFSCMVSINEPAPVTIPLLVQALSGGQALVAPGFSLQVAGPIGDADMQQLSDIQNIMSQSAVNVTQYGDSVQLRVMAMTALRSYFAREPGLTGQAVSLCPDGLSIGVRLDSGLAVVLALEDLADLLHTSADSAASIRHHSRAEAAAARLQPAQRPKSAERAALTPRDSSGPPQCGQYQRDVVQNNKVLLWDPGLTFFLEPWDGSPEILAPLINSKCPKLDVKPLRGSDATIQALDDFPSYGTVVMVTHGGIDPNRHYFFISGDVSILKFNYYGDANTTVGISCFPYGDVTHPLFGCFLHVYANSPHVRALNKGILYAAFCYSYNGQMISKFAPFGSQNAYYGFENATYEADLSSVGAALFDSLVNHYNATGPALQDGRNAFSGKSPYGLNELGATGDLNLAYVGNPAIVVPNRSAPYTAATGDSFLFRAMLDGTDSCNPPAGGQWLSCKWNNTPAAVGRLADSTSQQQNSFTNMASNSQGNAAPGANSTPLYYAQAQYSASSNPTGSADNITVDFLPDPSNPIAARACATVGGQPKLQVTDAFDELQDNGSIQDVHPPQLPFTVTANSSFQSPGIGDVKAMTTAYAYAKVTQSGPLSWQMEVKGQGYSQGRNNQLVQDSVQVVVTFPASGPQSEIKFSGFKGSGNCGISYAYDALDASGKQVANTTSNNNPSSTFNAQAPVDMKGATRAHLTLSLSAPAGSGGPNPCDAVAQIALIGSTGQ